MGTVDSGFIERFRRPEYTGENRCLPCTAVNLVVAVALAAVASLLTPAVGAVVFAASVAAIYLRGYLVPGTPRLTKQYLPDSVLRRFDKRSATAVDTELDPESQLLAVGAVEPEPDGDDLRLTDGFGAEWDAAVDRAKRDPAGEVADLLDLDEVEVHDREDACIVTDDGVEVARWPSEAALVADLGAVPVLRRRTTNLDDLSRAEQGQLLAGLRIFLESCPDCGGDLSFAEETVESCCRSVEVVTYDCEDCGARIMEVER